MICRYCGTMEAPSYVESVDGTFACGRCFIDKINLHKEVRQEKLDSAKLKAEAKEKKSATKRRK